MDVGSQQHIMCSLGGPSWSSVLAHYFVNGVVYLCTMAWYTIIGICSMLIVRCNHGWNEATTCLNQHVTYQLDALRWESHGVNCTNWGTFHVWSTQCTPF